MLSEFFNSSSFSAIVTILAALVAYIIYLLEKKSFKIQAARVILTEVRIAEDRFDQIRDKIASNTTSDLPAIFPSQSWKRYSHLFISDFDEDELKLINSFYDYGGLVEEFAQRNNNYFWIVTEERAKVTVQKIAEFVNESYGNSTPYSEVDEKRNYLSLGLDNYNLLYEPKKTLNGMNEYLSKIEKITTSTCGLKLKKLAKLSK